MSLWQTAFLIAERAPLPDLVIRYGIEVMVNRTSRSLAEADPETTARFARELVQLPVAAHADAANDQHYEVPAAFYEQVLGPQRKYSSCYYVSNQTSLSEAEERALELTAQHAHLADGQTILELGCGWGSLSLWMARIYPNARILSVSNSSSQRAFIERACQDRGLANLDVVTADMNVFSTARKFDRIVSVEMFEHMANWRQLLCRTRDWLEPNGRLFVHVFSHRTTPYRFDHVNKDDWIAQHFFTGGCMPSRALMHQFADVLEVENEWRWDGTHYARTASHWLANLDQNRPFVMRALDNTYGTDAQLWYRRWRVFFLATAAMFGFAQGKEWGVSHYLLKPSQT